MTSVMLSSQVLVLNRTFVPVHITSLKQALCMLYRGVAKVVGDQYELFDFDTWSELSIAQDEDRIGLVDKAIRVPRVILLQVYDRIPRRPVRFSRINVYLRDHNTCQYCARALPRSELNLDHVVPISLGGKTEWENIVCSCIPCNLKKGGRSPEQAHMKLIRKPVKPPWTFFFATLSKPTYYDQWRPFLTMIDFSYWNVELKD